MCIMVCERTLVVNFGRLAWEYILVPDLSTLFWECPLVVNLGILAWKRTLVPILGKMVHEHFQVADLGILVCERPWWSILSDWTRIIPPGVQLKQIHP